MNRFLVIGMIFTIFWDACAQLNRRQIKSTHRNAVHRQKFSFSPKAYTTVGIGLSAMNYYGDVVPKSGTLSTDITLTRPAFEFSVSRRLGPYYAIVGQLTIGQLRGSDRQSADKQDRVAGYRYVRNISFRNNIQEFNVSAHFEFPANHSHYFNRSKLAYYFSLGLGILHHNPQGKVPATDLNGEPFDNAGEWINLRELGTEGQYSELLESDANYGIKPYGLFQPTVPLGLGLRYKHNQVIDVSCEFSVRFLFTDYLDDVSRNYVDLGVLESDLAKSMSYRSYEVATPESSALRYAGRDGQVYNVVPGYGSEHPSNIRGNKSDNDLFTSLTLRASFIINGKMHKPKRS